MLAACGGGGGASSGERGEVGDADLEVQVASVTERAEPTIADARDVGAVGDATAAFGLDLFQRVASVEDGNVIVGPVQRVAGVGDDDGRCLRQHL